MEYQDTEQKRKIRIVTIATIVIVVVLGLGVWLVAAAISSTKKDSNVAVENTTVTKDTKAETKTEQKTETKSNSAKTEATTDKPASTATSPANQYGSEKKTTTTTTPAPAVVTPAREEVPNTGPEDVWFVALLAGVSVYLIGLNINLKKRANDQNA